MLNKDYPNIIAAAKSLCGSSTYEESELAIEKSYSVCEKAWARNLKRIQGVPVKYLLICEAPPAPIDGYVSYFYETFDNAEFARPTGWIRSILFMFNGRDPVQSVEHSLGIIAANGMLLVDSMPTALRLTSNLRKKPAYKHLALQSSDYLIDKLNNSNILWANDVKIALGFKLNAQVLIDIYSDGITLPNGQTLRLSESQIVADGSGYPSAQKLRNLWGLE